MTRPLYGQRRAPVGIGPWFAFGTAIAAATVVWAGLIGSIPTALMTPVAVTLLFAFAAGLALLARARSAHDPGQITYTDVAGALTLIGLCAAAMIDPEQLSRAVAGPSSQP
jgi:hypothetical protein